MEEKLRRLGLGSDAALDPLRGKGEDFSEKYLEKIRTEQKDRRRLRREKEYRRYISSDQYLKEGDLGAEGKVVQAVVDSARDMLLVEKRRTEEFIRRTDLKEMEKYNRAACFDKVMALERNHFDGIKTAPSGEAVAMPRLDVDVSPSVYLAAPPLSGYSKVFTTGINPNGGFGGVHLPPNAPKNLRKHQMAVELCHDVVKGLIELAFVVSDNRFLLSEELTGKPVKSLDQDLKVTQWRDWVQCCLYKKPFESLRGEVGGSAVPGARMNVTSCPTADSCSRDLRGPAGDSNACPTDGSPAVSSSATAFESSNDNDPFTSLKGRSTMPVEEEKTSELFSLAVGLEELQEVKVQNDVIMDVMAFLQGEGRRLRKIALEDIRRLGEEQEEECMTPVARSLELGDLRRRSGTLAMSIIDPSTVPAVPTLVAREELLPHWTHRMPFACTIVHGDELSGARLLMEAVERQVRHASIPGMPAKGAQGVGGIGASEGVGSEAQLSGTNLTSPSTGSAANGKLHDKVGAAAQHNQEKMMGAVRVQDGVKKTYITPRTLLGRAQPTLNKEGVSKGGSRHAGSGGKAAPHHRSAVEDDERKDFDAMAEILSREIVKAHFHNLTILSGGKLPPIQLGAVAPAPVDHNTNRRGKSGGAGGGNTGSSATKKLEEQRHASPSDEKTVDDESLHCLFLIGFPENELFYQMLEVRMGPAIEAAETALAVEQQKMEELAAAQLASTLSGTRGRSQSNSAAPRAKQQGSTVASAITTNLGGKGSKGAAKNAALEDVSSLVAQLHAKKVFPPLCILGFFLEYNIPARHRRLKNAYFLSASSCQGSSGGSSSAGASVPAAGPNFSNAAVASARGVSFSPPLLGTSAAPLSSSSIPYLFHPVYNPESSSFCSPLSPLNNNNAGTPNASIGFASTVGSASFLPPPGASVTINKDSVALRNSNEKNTLFNNTSTRNDNVGASTMGLSLSSSAAPSGGGGMGGKKKIAATDWDIATVHRELMQRHSKMKNWKAQWQAAMGSSAMIYYRRLASGPPAQSPKEKTKKRGPKSGGNSASGSVSSSPTTTLPLGAVNATKEGFQASTHGSGAAAISGTNVDIYSFDPAVLGNREVFHFPKVLYFCKTNCVNDFASEMGATEENNLSDGSREEQSGTYFTASPSPFFFIGSGKPNDNERAHVVEVLLRKIAEATRPLMNPMMHSQLVPSILPEPLRLSDYRLPNELCQDLVHRYNLYEQKLFLRKALPSPHSLLPGGTAAPGGGNGVPVSSMGLPSGSSAMPLFGERAIHHGFGESMSPHHMASPVSIEDGKGGDCSFNSSPYGLFFSNYSYLQSLNPAYENGSFQKRLHKKDILQVEISVYRCFAEHLYDLLHILSGEAFPDSIWRDGRQQTRNFSHTAHYVSIDKNAAELKERMECVNVSYTEELHWRCALLLRYAVDTALETAATTMSNVYTWIQRSFFELVSNSAAGLHSQSTLCHPLPGSLSISPVQSANLSMHANHPSTSTTPASTAGLSLTPGTSSLSSTHRSALSAGANLHAKHSPSPQHPTTSGSVESGAISSSSVFTAVLPSPPEQAGKTLDFPSGTNPSHEDDEAVPSSPPAAPSPPRARRICDQEFRLSKEKSLALISLLSHGEEKGLKGFWEVFCTRVIAPLQKVLEEEFREHIQYFAQLQEYQHQLLIIQAKKAAQESATSALPAVCTPTNEPKKNSPGASPARRSSRKGGSRQESRISPPKKGSSNTNSTTSSSPGSAGGGGTSGGGAAPPSPLPTLPALLGAERPKSFPWSEKHMDPVSELQWDSYITSIVSLVVTEQIASPNHFSWDDKNPPVESSKALPGHQSALNARTNNTGASPGVTLSNPPGGSRESVSPPSVEMSWNVGEGDGAGTMLFAVGTAARTGDLMPPVPPYPSLNGLQSSSTPALYPGLRVAASLGRTIVLIKEIIRCDKSARRSGEKWLEVMYQTALGAPTNEGYPEEGRPKTISDLFSAPPSSPPSIPHVGQGHFSLSSLHSLHHSSTAGGLPTSFLSGESSDSYGWPRLNLELLLLNFSIYGKQELTQEEFLHCASLTQLCQMCRHVHVNLKELASTVGYAREGPGGTAGSHSGGAAEQRTPSVPVNTKKQRDDFGVQKTMISSSGGGTLPTKVSKIGNACEENTYRGKEDGSGGCLPDVLNASALLQAPCREAQYRQLPFLSVGELITLFHRSATRSNGTTKGKDGGKHLQLNLRWWLFNVICRRYCFCQNHRCAYLRSLAVPLPTGRELRRAVSLLPECVVHASSSAIPLLPPYASRRVQDGPPFIKDTGIPMEWWSCESLREKNQNGMEGEERAAEKEHAGGLPASVAGLSNGEETDCFAETYAPPMMKRAITRIATSTFSMSKYGVLRQEYPSLPLVLYLLAHHPDSIEDSMSRMFHCFSALMMKSAEPHCFFEAGGAESLAASKVHLTVDEFVGFFSCIFQSSRASPSCVFSPSSSFRGALQSCGAQVPGSATPSLGGTLALPQETLPLEVDAQLLLQVEGKERISLAMLLSSHWGRSLVASHVSSHLA